jgi:hypothetical protein
MMYMIYETGSNAGATGTRRDFSHDTIAGIR